MAGSHIAPAYSRPTDGNEHVVRRVEFWNGSVFEFHLVRRFEYEREILSGTSENACSAV
jgi:hypothetical protein